MTSCLESKMSFVILKAQSEENKQVDPYVNALEDRGHNAWLIPTLEFEYHNLDQLKTKLKSPQHYSGESLSVLLGTYLSNSTKIHYKYFNSFPKYLSLTMFIYVNFKYFLKLFVSTYS